MPDRTELPNLRWTKLNRPRIAGDVVRRARAWERLERGLDRPVTLVCAPAGYGKTTLLSGWLADSGHPHAWLSLDENDSDPAIFLSYFVAAIRTVYPEACARTLDLLRTPELPPTSLLVTALANDLETLPSEPSLADERRPILVLDDYQLVRSEAVHTLLAELLRHPPRSVHLILSTRQDPPLPLNVLRARGELGEIRMQELRFTPEEIALFMRQAFESPLEEHEIAFLAERTEGWPAGLRLAALTLATSDDIRGHLAELPADNRYVMDYLMDEVLSHVPASTQEFLLKTSILDRMSGPLCDAVTGAAEAQWTGQAYLEWLAQRNLFTWSLDPQQQWYRYHHLFRKLLRSRLEQQRSPEQIAGLHARAGAWHADRGFVDEAIRHALAAGDLPGAAGLVEAHRHEAMNHERWFQLEGWLGLFSRQAIDSRPELLALEAWVLHQRFRLADVPRCLDRLEAVMEHRPLPEAVDRRIRSEIDALRSQLFYWTADSERTLEAAQRALETVPREAAYVRGIASVYYAGALQLQGNIAGALGAIHDGLREARLHGDAFQARQLMTLCAIYWVEADLPNQIQAANGLLHLARERSLPESETRGYYYLGCAHYQQNDLAAAETDFAAVVERRYAAYSLIFAQSAFGLAAVYQTGGQADRARAVVEAVIAHALEVNDPAMLADAKAFGAHLALHQGQQAEAQYWGALYDRNFRPAPMPVFYVAPLTLVEFLLAQGTPESLEEASQALTRLRDLVVRTHNTRFLIETLALQALVYDARRERSAALEALKQAVALAEPGGVIRVFVDLGPKMAALLHVLATGRTPPGFVAKLLEAFPAARLPEPAARQASLIEPLSDRELEVLGLLAERLSNKEIARELSISPMTVKRHTVNIYQKLLVQGRREAVARAIALGILPAVPRG